MKGEAHLIGKNVKVRFAEHWPAESGEFEYQGFDDSGHWVKSLQYGNQRYYINEDIEDIEVLPQ